MINLKEWPTDYKTHAGCTWSSDEFAPYMGPATVTLTFEQYALAAKAVRVLAQMEEKELPDSDGWWFDWEQLGSFEIDNSHRMYYSGYKLYPIQPGRWIKIPTPEEVR